MAWIKTIPFQNADEKLLGLLKKQRGLYPPEYGVPVEGHPESIAESHTLIPDAMYHIFSAFGALMSPDLPLERRQQEMIATVVSATNDCHY